MNQAEVDTTQLLKGVLDLAVLAVLAEADSYGYDVVRRLREGGLDHVGDASVYGTLRRLYQAGALNSYVVPSDEGPHRKYYGLNNRGRKALEQSAQTWVSLSKALNHLLNGRSNGHGTCGRLRARPKVRLLSVSGRPSSTPRNCARPMVPCTGRRRLKKRHSAT